MASEDIKRILNIVDPSQTLQIIQGFIFDQEKRESIFDEILELEPDLKHDFFTAYFEEERAYRKSLKQDYTPQCLCDLISMLAGSTGKIIDKCCGSGGLFI